MAFHVKHLVGRMLLCLAAAFGFLVPLAIANPSGASTVGDTAKSIALGELGPNQTRGNLENPMESGCNKYTGALVGHTTGTAPCAGQFGNRNFATPPGLPWCSDFATWVWHQAGADITGLNQGSWTFYTYGQRNGTWHPASSGYVPQPGDAILYDLTTSPLYSSHVGIVVSASNPPDVVQGNWGDANGTNWGVVFDSQSKQATTKKVISGYISPVPSGTTPAGGSGGGTTSTYPAGIIGPGISGFSSTTPDASWFGGTGHGYAGQELWTFGNGPTSANTATWSSALSAGVYNVQAYIPDDHATAVATYNINDSSGSHAVSINQNAYTNSFANLGNFTLSANGTMSVVLTDKTSAAFCNCLANEVTADAMKFTYVGPVVLSAPNVVQGITAVQPAKVTGTLKISWTPGSGALGSLRYTATAARGSVRKTCATTGASCQVTGLAVGHYVVTVIAKSDFGTSSPSAAVNAFVLSTPSSVQGVTVTVSRVTARIKWGAPSWNGGHSLSYLVTTSGGLSCTSNSTTCSLTGLRTGTTYVFSVVASNGFATSVATKSALIKVTGK